MKIYSIRQIVILILSLILNVVSYGDDLLYKSPTFNNLKAFLLKSENSTSNLSHSKKEHNYNLCVIMTTKAIEKNPLLIKQITQEYKSLPSQTQKILLQSLMNANQKPVVQNLAGNNAILQEKNIALEVEKRKFIVKNNKEFTTEDLNDNSTLADYLWVAFYATGDEKYVKQIIDFTKSWPEDLYKIAYEMLNRDSVEAMKHIGNGAQSNSDKNAKYKDIIEKIKASSLYNVHQLFSLYIVLWSLDSNTRQHPEVQRIVQSYK